MSYRGGPLRRILVATNLDPVADAAVDTAAVLAATVGASVHLLCVLEALMYTPRGMAQLAARDPSTHAEATRRMNAQVERARAHGVVSVEGTIEFGVATDRVLARANSGDFDLLVLGNRGERGSLAEYVISRVKIPLLVAPPPPKR